MRKNFILSLLSASAKVLGGVGLLAVLARVFPLSDFGVFTYSLTFATVLALVIDYGYNLKLLNDISKDPTEMGRLVTCSVLIKLLLFITILGVFYTTSQLFQLNNITPAFVIYLFVGLTAFSLINSFLSAFKSTSRYDLDALVVVFDNFFTLLITVIIAFITEDLGSTTIAFGSSKLASLVFSSVIFAKRYKFERVTYQMILKDLKLTFPFAIHYIIGNLYLNIDTLVINNYVEESQLGIYQAGIRIVIGSGILLTVANSLYMPILSSSFYNKTSCFQTNARQLNAMLLKLGMVFLILSNFFSEEIILLVFGSKFMELDSFFWVFTLIIFIRTLGVSYGMLLTVSKNQYYRALFGILSVVLIVGLDVLVVPSFGLYGAALILLFGHLILNSLYLLICYREFSSIFVPTTKQLFSLKL